MFVQRIADYYRQLICSHEPSLHRDHKKLRLAVCCRKCGFVSKGIQVGKRLDHQEAA